ncbi:hypothetical protein NECAME_05715 [Necator americanus]|uniref:Uncharacterized protein n=1 Tax=Necator americanus TaxID=51031 RepID=W2SF40_NECAM|nr:hypothetical protein NECAME_05715 [Necator americanus]ETN68234.1 hypothetical protein NECAME_05715 [Necator americanus]
MRCIDPQEVALLTYSDVLPIFGWTIRDISSDANWYVEAADKDVMVDFVQEVHKKIFMDFGRDIHWPGFTITDITSHNLREILKKHIRRVLSKEQETSEKTKIISEETPVSRSFAFATLGLSSFPENLDAPYVLCADDPIDATCLSFPFSEAELVPTARCGSKTMMPLSEETEKAFEFENSDKEN